MNYYNVLRLIMPNIYEVNNPQAVSARPSWNPSSGSSPALRDPTRPHHRPAVASRLAPASVLALLLSSPWGSQVTLCDPGKTVPALLHSHLSSSLALCPWGPAPPPPSLSSDPQAPSWTLSTFLPMPWPCPFLQLEPPPHSCSAPSLPSFISLPQCNAQCVSSF